MEMDEKRNSEESTKDIQSPMLPQVGELTDAVATFDRTLSQLKRVNAVFKETQEMMATFADNSREGIVLVQDNKFLWVNKSACKISGYSFEEMLALPVSDIVSPTHRDRLMARTKLVLSGDTISEAQEWPVLRKDRMLRYVRIFSYRVIFRQQPAIISFFYDVTEEKKLSDESQMRAQILDSVNDQVIVTDLLGKIVYVNDAVFEMMGYPKEDLLKMNILEITAPEYRKKAVIRLKQASEHKEARFFTIGIRNDGSRINLDVRAKIIKRGGKQFVLTVGRENPPENHVDNGYDKA